MGGELTDAWFQVGGYKPRLTAINQDAAQLDKVVELIKQSDLENTGTLIGLIKGPQDRIADTCAH